MRILFITNLFPPEVYGGAELLCAQVASGLHGKGHEITVLTTAVTKPTREAEIQSFPVIRDLTLHRGFDRQPTSSRIARIRPDRQNGRVTRSAIRKFKPDVVFAWSHRRLGVAPAKASQIAGVPTAFIFNDDSPFGLMPRSFAWHSPMAWIRYVTDRTVFRNYTTLTWDLEHVVCISEHLKQRLVNSGFPVARARVIHQGIPIEQFPSKPEPGGLHSPLRLLYVGRLNEQKGVRTLLESLRLLAGRLGNDRFWCTIVGEGEPAYTRRLREMVPPGCQVKFAGQVSHEKLPGIYREHDILVFPSVSGEAFGLTFLEAMASGTTVVATCSGGQGEFLLDSVNGLVFEALDSAQLTECIIRIANDPALSARLASAARNQIAERYNLTAFVDRLETFLEQGRLNRN